MIRREKIARLVTLHEAYQNENPVEAVERLVEIFREGYDIKPFNDLTDAELDKKLQEAEDMFGDYVEL